MTQKILAAHAGLESVKAGQLIEANLDLVLGNDITSPVAVKEFEKFVVVARIPDMVNNNWITIKMYPGNRTAEPIEFDADGLPTLYQNCKVNIVDCGVIE